VLAICGFSGSGKTTLLEAVIPRLVAKALSVAVVKHDAHGVTVDTVGKDSDRLFRAGATVALRGPDQQFQRRGNNASLSLEATLADLARDHDLILVEGHKNTPLPKFWLEDASHTSIPSTTTSIIAILQWDSERAARFLEFIDVWLPKAWGDRLVHRGLLIGGNSSRMGSPKQLLYFGGKPLGAIAASALARLQCPGEMVTLGSGPVPEPLASLANLPDVPGFKGPVAGLISAHRWAPTAAWIIAACDHPWLRSEDLEWLRSQRRPGTWAVIPRQEDGHPCPILALYEPQALVELERKMVGNPEQNARIALLLDHARTLIVEPPPEHTRAWKDVNTPEEFRN
jgi:molybdopterin-guanine dinucleotide biosynthesis protein MobB